MSLFGSLLGDFDDDAYLGNHMNAMNMQMRNMNRVMNMNSLMPDPFNMLTPFGVDGGFNNHHALLERHNVPSMGSLFGFPSMPNMNRLLSADIGANGGASFCSSSVISMSSGPDGRPQIYQATSSTKTGPGGIRETRKTVQDSRTGVKKMAIGHHIGERGHIIEKEQNLHSGENEERQEFINLEEEEATDFDREFVSKANIQSGLREIAGPKDQQRSHQRHQRQLPAVLPPTQTNSSSKVSQSTANSNVDNDIEHRHHAATEDANSNILRASNYLATSYLSRWAYRNVLAAATALANPRRPLRTPSSSPLVLASASQSALPSTSVHPHPYNNSGARRNYRLKHSKKQEELQSTAANEPKK